MSDVYDAVVIGAGLGGLTAAARLVKEGLSVLVLESDPHPGGTAYSYPRKDFLFPMGPLGFSSPQLVRDILAKAGVSTALETRRVHYELWAFGMRVPISLPFPGMISSLSGLFPGEEAAISRFFGHVSDIAHLQERLAWEGHSRPRRKEGVDAADYLGRLIKDWRLRRILGSMGSREPYSDMALLASMWNLISERGIHYPAMGMRGLCDILAGALGWLPCPQRLEENHAPVSTADRGHGTVVETVSAHGNTAPCSLRLNARVAGIMVEGGKAAGVVLDNGDRFLAKAVVSNADFKTTFLHLLPRETVPDKLFEDIAAARQTLSNLQVCLGLDMSRADLSAYRGASRIIYRRHTGDSPPSGAGPDWDAPTIDPSTLAGEEIEATLLSADDPALAPVGHAVMVIRTAVPHRHFARFRPQRARRSRGYFRYKLSLAQALVEEVAGFVPGLNEAVVYMDVATPLTFEERGGRSDGAVAGWSWERGEREGGEALELIRTPIAGLYMAGYQAFSMLALGGVPSAMLSGLKAAEYLLAGAGPVEEMRVPK